MLHIKSGDSGASVSSTSDELVIEGSSVGMSFLDATDGATRIAFGDSGDNDIGKIVYGHSSNQMEFVTNTATGLVIDGNGHVTMPKQSAFLVNPTSDQTNIANDAWVTIAFGTEVYDQNADFASNTFTAPVTGKYFLHCQIRTDNPDTASNYIWVKLVTSNREIYGTLYDLGGLSGDPVYWNMAISALADMDANDTVTVQVRSSLGTAQMDISTNTHFSGFLAC